MVMRGSVIVPANRHLPLLFAFTLPPNLGSNLGADQKVCNLDPSFCFEIEKLAYTSRDFSDEVVALSCHPMPRRVRDMKNRYYGGLPVDIEIDGE